MFGPIKNLFFRQDQRPAWTLALYGSSNQNLDLMAGLNWILDCSRKLNLPAAEWVTWNFGEAGKREFKTSSFDAWNKRGRPLPSTACTSVEVGRFLQPKKQGLGDYTWYVSLSNAASCTFCVDLTLSATSIESIGEIVLSSQEIGHFEYGYVFEMDMEKGPAFYGDGGTLNGDKHFSQPQREEIAKWSHAMGEHKKFDLPVSELFRDVFSINVINPHHLAMRVKGQSLKDWIEADSKRGTLKPLIEGELWTWAVPENRMASVRKTLGSERLLISWGDFNTPSGGPLGHTYGAKKGEIPIFPGKPLSIEDQRWVTEGLALMRPIFERYTHEPPDHFDRLISRSEPLFGKLLDMAFTAWSQDVRIDRPTPEEALHAVAASLGEYLVKHHRMAWYVVEDEHGRSLAVCHRGKGDARTWSYPVDTVAKRIDRGETGFVVGIIEAVGEQIRQG